jgi:hypothetical protein
MVEAPDNLVLQLPREMRAAQAATHLKVAAVQAAQVATDGKIAEIQSGLHSLRADVASDMPTMRKEIGERIAGLHRAVIEYRSAVIGHHARAPRLEQNAGLSPMDA